MLRDLPCYLLVTPGNLVVTSGFWVVISGFLIVTFGYSSLLLVPCFSNSESGPQKLLIWSSFRNHKNLKIRFKAWKNFTLCEFEVEHAFPNQSHPLPSFDHHHALPGAYLRCILLTLYQIQSLSVDVLMQALKKKIVPSAQEVSIHFLIKMFLKNNPLPPWPISLIHISPLNVRCLPYQAFLVHGHHLTEWKRLTVVKSFIAV